MEGSGFPLIVDLSTNTVSVDDELFGITATFLNVQNVIGSAAIDTITGDNNDNIIEGGRGADILDGGLGIDTLSYESSEEAVFVDLLSVAQTGTVEVMTNFFPAGPMTTIVTVTRALVFMLIW